MTALVVRQDWRNQHPLTPQVVYWSERVGGWWGGMPTRCGACRGALFATPPDAYAPGQIACGMCGRETADVLYQRPPVITPEQFKALPTPPRGRPKRRGPNVCAGCCQVRVDKGTLRCAPCSRKHRDAAALTTRLLMALSDGRPKHRRVLCELLNVELPSLRQAIKKGRMRGYLIVLKNGAYQMVGEK